MELSRRKMLLGASALAASGMLSNSFSNAHNKNLFNMNFAPHEGMFKTLAGDDIVDQINFAASQGFRSWEDNWLVKRSVNEQNRIGKALADNSMTMGVFIASDIDWVNPTMSLGDKSYISKFKNELKNSIEVAERVNAKWVTVVPGVADLKIHPNYPGLILTEAAQAYYLCKAVDSPSCKILFDIYHQQISEGHLIANIDQAWEEIAYFQIGDTPGRNEPTSGEINFKNIFKHIYNKGYRGVMGMEHGNSIAGVDGENAVIDAYLDVGNFL